MESVLVVRLFTQETLLSRDIVACIGESIQGEFFMLINPNSADIRCKKITKSNLEKAQSFVKGFMWGRREFTLAQWKEEYA